MEPDTNKDRQEKTTKQLQAAIQLYQNKEYKFIPYEPMERTEAVLGRSFHTWKSTELEVILKHYCKTVNRRTFNGRSWKSYLFNELKKFSEANDITRGDCMRILGRASRRYNGPCKSPDIIRTRACRCFVRDGEFLIDDETASIDVVEQDATTGAKEVDLTEGVANSTFLGVKNMEDESMEGVTGTGLLDGEFNWNKPSVSDIQDKKSHPAGSHYPWEDFETAPQTLNPSAGLLDNSAQIFSDASIKSSFQKPISALETSAILDATAKGLEPVQLAKQAEDASRREVCSFDLDPTNPDEDFLVQINRPLQRMATRQAISTIKSQVAQQVTQARQHPEEVSENMPSSNICTICSDPMVNGNRATDRITSGCNEVHDVCLACVAHSLQSQFESKVWNQLTCPVCEARLSHGEIKKYAPGPVFERYDSLATFEAMSQMPGFKYCERQGCGAGQIHYEQHDQPIVTCVGCGNKTCFTHQTPWHEGRTCAEFDAENKDAKAEQAQANRASKAAIASLAKPCPNCRRPIEKNGGCQHMRCLMCRQEFCWDCLALWERIQMLGNTAHSPACPWHSSNLPSLDGPYEA